MAQIRLTDKDDAVSEIIGELMVLFITVAIFGLVVVAVNGMLSRSHTDIVSIGAANNSTTITLTHMGGDSIDYQYISAIVNGNNVSYTKGDSNGNGLWDLGEALAVPNPPPGQGLDVIVYDSGSHSVLGDFTLR
jgi:archaeal type IV pilus assembly protein PilA